MRPDLPLTRHGHDMTDIDLSTLFSESDAPLHLSNGQRNEGTTGSLRWVQDAFAGADCLFLRASTKARFRLAGDFRLLRCALGGWLLQNRDAVAASYWVPASAILRRISEQGHILQERAIEPDEFDLDTNGMAISFADVPAQWKLDAVIWRLGDASLVDEWQGYTPVETQGYFLLGSHTRYGKPADLYRHLVHGWVYEDRYAWPHKRRICSENDAHALYLILSGLQLVTGKRLYGVLKAQLLLSVLSRQTVDGGFRHGEWTEGMESHYRLHCSALHLMMDALNESDDPVVREALRRAAAFISDKRDETAVGPWFYHDELETTLAGMGRAPFKWWPGTALGKAPQNMLVLNTQLDTLVALDRYRRLTGDAQYGPIVDAGFAAARVVLGLRPMEWLYRLIFSAIDLTLLPTEQAAVLPAWQRLWKRVGWQLFIPRLPRLKTRYPRLVMPGGYIDRELSLQTWAYDYLAVNLMDLVRAAQGDQRDPLMPYVNGILDYCGRTGIARRWLEHKGRAYALGFLAEALVLLCLRESRPGLDAMLAESLLLCVERGLGLPPSLLGGNAEAQELPPANVPQAGHTDIVVANLSGAGRPACLVVNAGTSPIALNDALRSVPPAWRLPTEALPPGGWLRLEA